MLLRKKDITALILENTYFFAKEKQKIIFLKYWKHA